MRHILTALTAASIAGFAVAMLAHFGTWFFLPGTSLQRWLMIAAVVLLLPAGVVSRQIALTTELRRAFTPEAQGWGRSVTLLVYAAFANAALHLVIVMAAGFSGEAQIPADDVRVIRLLTAFAASFYAIAWAIWDSRRRIRSGRGA